MLNERKNNTIFSFRIITKKKLREDPKYYYLQKLKLSPDSLQIITKKNTKDVKLHKCNIFRTIFIIISIYY